MNTLDNTTKKIVKGMIQRAAKLRNKNPKNMSLIDEMTEEAIKRAKDEMLEGADTKIKNHIIAKIDTSRAFNIPWEELGDTFCGRRQFYIYRSNYMYLIAVHMGIAS